MENWGLLSAIGVPPVGVIVGWGVRLDGKLGYMLVPQ